ncbi:molybdate ABC transporter substrate-binding protein [Baaleninema simplex]|uniref:molybdate ABC transporter substrate-binding protein n=1 Tax=Baaleninema simplex TaxID=2862350 RepID=UPI0003464195|nr:molybdate ABC transporter substrate-binding protein [Baaleninema simplex]
MVRLALLLLVLPLAACAIESPSATAPETASDTTTLTVAAAASLTDAMTDLAEQFEERYPNIDVRLNFAASGTLQRQIEQQAPVDVFASAAQKPMDELERQGLVDPETRRVFAANRIVVVVPQESEVSLKSLDELKTPEIDRLAMGNPDTVPAGRYAKQALEAAQLYGELETAQTLVFAENVRQVLAYVEQNSVDAAIVYQTDAAISDRVRVAFPIPADFSEPIRYPIAVVGQSEEPEAARSFVEFVAGSESQAILDKYGFLTGD